MLRSTIIAALMFPPAWASASDRGPQAEPAGASASSRKAGEDAAGKAVDRLVEQLRRHPARPSRTAGQVGLYLIDAEGGDATPIASEPDPQLNQCGSPSWSHDGRRILFDATPGRAKGNADFSRSHLKSIELEGGRLSVMDLGAGNCPDFSPADDRIIFLLNPGGVPGAQTGVWLMQSDGSGRQFLGTYGRPKWSPESRQFAIIDFSTPAQVTIMDVRPEHSGVLQFPGRSIFSTPAWAGEGTLVAVIDSGAGAGPGDAIALVDVTDPARGRVKEVLWKSGKALDVQPYCPAYSPATRRCVFIGKAEGKGRALYTFRLGDPDPPRRLEAGGRFDNLIQDPTFSPDGRYIVFSSDRDPDRVAPVVAPRR